MIRKVLLILAWTTAMVFAHGVAGAQEPFSAQTLSASTLNAAQQEQIETFMEEVVTGLTRAEAVQIMNARRAAQRELARPEVRVPFRLEFASKATPRLADLVKAQNDLTAINAIYILGDIATSQSTTLLLDALKDQRECVRYAAVVALEKTFTTEDAVIPSRDIDVIRRQMTAQLASEQSSKVAAAYVRTLSSAADPQRCRVAGLRNAAITMLGVTFADRIANAEAPDKPVDAAMMDAMLLAGETLRGELTRVGATVPDQQAKDASRLAGHVLAYVRRRAMAGDINQHDAPGAVRTERQNLQTLAQLGEQVIIFAGTKLGKSISPPGLPGLIEQEQDEKFATDVLGLIGPDGALTAPPFDFPDNEFVKE